MNEFWTFAGNYWWLAFPILAMTSGAIGGVYKAMEKSAKRRHERRMETLRLKAEIKTAQIAARGGTPARTVLPAKSAPAAASAQLLARTLAEHDEITARWLDYELDVAKLIAYPTISDGRQPLTAAFLRAKKTADRLRPASPKAQLTDQELAAYAGAVTDYEVAFDVAEREARRLKDSDFTDTERKRLQTAQRLLAVAVDSAATPAERQVAYKRVREELDGLIVVSDEAIVVLEEKVALPLDAGASRPTAD